MKTHSAHTSVFVIGLLVLIIFSTGFATPTFAAEQDAGTPTNLSELGDSIDALRVQMKVPGAAVGIILNNGEVWQHHTGLADIESNLPITQNTQFRWGSVSKMFVSLSILKLVEDGKLNLDQNVNALAAEIEFENPWKDTHPLKLKHLLAHSSGWDAPHFAEQVAQSDTPITIKDALSLHPHSRESRWPPGTRIAYNNTGFLVAAYIVEKVSGLSYEQFVQSTFFNPLDMSSANYFFSDGYRNNAATLYRQGMKIPYWHLNNRAAGGLNSNIEDMLKFTGFLIRNSKADQNDLLLEASWQSFEKPQATAIADAGIELSWSLGNQIFHSNGQIMHGHEGSLPGSNTMLVYSPRLKVGYVIATNTNSPFVPKVHELIAGYLTQGAQSVETDFDTRVSESDLQLAGWYQDISPGSNLVAPFTRLIPWKLTMLEDRALIGPIVGGKPRELIPVGEGQFIQPTTTLIALSVAEDGLAGKVILYGIKTLKKSDPLLLLVPVIVFALWLAVGVLSILNAFIWIPRILLGKITNKQSIALRVWPFFAFLIMLFIAATLWSASSALNPINVLGTVSFHSLSIFALSVAFMLATLWSVKIWFQHRAVPMNAYVKWHSTLFIVLNVMIFLYLLGNGLVGLRTWV
tara:strand:- start:164 stop:2062 length:1899 start_codon:yes stop_codon:yes gene_type:complete